MKMNGENHRVYRVISQARQRNFLHSHFLLRVARYKNGNQQIEQDENR